MADRIIGGTVNSDGTIKYGSEFSVSRTTEGHYVIAFRPGFAQVSGASATQIFPDDGNTRDNVVIIRLTPSELYLKTGDSNGNAKDRNFSFIATGIGSVAAVEKD
ncbi:MAG TPA: hypothetical protein VNC39_00330 [Acidocella sp.]|jgi:hypothetical protein|uniref:hypothetical protein n=1 Tax=Acidocella sp. TaxID=50710 RepID=UPI002B8B4A2A|nr:hypothetical protein [Acidocella sp.]HVE20397.1 hypothetical protein [Acidocella sp.]